MNREERLAYMRKKFRPLEDNRVDAVLPTGKHDVQDEIGLIDGFREFRREHSTSRDTLTSDEG